MIRLDSKPWNRRQRTLQSTGKRQLIAAVPLRSQSNPITNADDKSGTKGKHLFALLLIGTQTFQPLKYLERYERANHSQVSPKIICWPHHYPVANELGFHAPRNDSRSFFYVQSYVMA